MAVKKFIVKCSECGKITSPRLPKGGNGTFWYPRRHKHQGKDCPGNIEEAIIITEIKPS